MLRAPYYSFPKTQFRGSFIRGHAEIEESDSHVIEFKLLASPYVSESSREKSKGDIKQYRVMVDKYFASERLESLVRGILPAPFLLESIELTLPFFNEFERIYDNCSIWLRVTVGVNSRSENPEDYNELILVTMRLLDKVLGNVEQDSRDLLSFTPLTLGKMRNENKMKLLSSKRDIKYSYLKGILY